MKTEELDLETLETVRFTFHKDAFRAKEMYCERCSRKMRLEQKIITLPDGFVSVRLNVFKCRKCRQEYLNFEEARKLGHALALSRAMRQEGYKIRKSLSFDGDNYVFRIPADMARTLGKHPHADMIPLSSKDFLIHLASGRN